MTAPRTSPSPGFLLLTSEQAGSNAPQRLDAARAELGAVGPVEVVTAGSVDECDAAIAAIDGRTLVVAGGDGTIHITVARLDRAGLLATTPIGIVPLGTGNDLARALGIALDPAAAAAQVVSGRPRPVDLLRDDAGGVVVNAVHAGVGAEAAAQADGAKDGLGVLAYRAGALVAAVREEGWQLAVTADGERLTAGQPVLMVGVGNGPTIGGGAPLHPRARPDDGLLDVVVVGAVGPAARTAFALALRRGDHLERDDVVYRQARAVTIDGEAVRVAADGEVSEPSTGRRYRVEAAAWQVVAPPVSTP